MEREKCTENSQQFCVMFSLYCFACMPHTGSWLHAPPTCRSVGCWVGRLNGLMVGWMLRWLVRWLISTTPRIRSGPKRTKIRKGGRQKRNNNKTAAAVNAVDARASLCDIVFVVVAVAVVVVVLHL